MPEPSLSWLGILASTRSGSSAGLVRQRLTERTILSGYAVRSIRVDDFEDRRLPNATGFLAVSVRRFTQT
jgi:hypothetical protein